jgi:hypothetical protein
VQGEVRPRGGSSLAKWAGERPGGQLRHYLVEVLTRVAGGLGRLLNDEVGLEIHLAGVHLGRPPAAEKSPT